MVIPKKRLLIINIVFLTLMLSVVIGVSSEVKITSDQFVVNESSSKATFTGNVIINQPDLLVYANKVIVYYGTNGPSDLEKLEAFGNVKIEQPEQIAYSNRAIYDPKTEILTLYDNIKVINDSGTITGSKLIIDIATGISKFPSQTNGGRVTAIFSQ